MEIETGAFLAAQFRMSGRQNGEAGREVCVWALLAIGSLVMTSIRVLMALMKAACGCMIVCRYILLVLSRVAYAICEEVLAGVIVNVQLDGIEVSGSSRGNCCYVLSGTL